MNIATTRHQLREARVVVDLAPEAAGALVEALVDTEITCRRA